MNKQYRQGDVIIIAVESSNLDSYKEVPREEGRVVLAHGEVTGHSHSIHSKAASLWVKEGELNRILRVKGLGVVNLLHEEHGPIELPPGDYIVRIQREYTPEVIRNIAD